MKATEQQLQEIVNERKARLTKGFDKLKYKDYGNIDLAIEGRGTNLRIWTGNEKCIAEGGGKKMIFMRIDCYNQYSVPLSEDNVKFYLKENHDAMNSLIKFGFESDIECLDEILEITKKMKERPCRDW